MSAKREALCDFFLLQKDRNQCQNLACLFLSVQDILKNADGNGYVSTQLLFHEKISKFKLFMVSQWLFCEITMIYKIMCRLKLHDFKNFSTKYHVKQECHSFETFMIIHYGTIHAIFLMKTRFCPHKISSMIQLTYHQKLSI